MSDIPRAGIVITGTEVLNGRVRDANGPWLADRLTELGVDHETTVVVGDRPQDMRGALDWLASQGVALVITSGGLGPTADDLTIEVVAAFQGRDLALDEPLQGRIAAKLEPLLQRFPNLDIDAWREGTRKQALVPVGATVLEPVGTAPGLVSAPASGEGPTIVVLPGPPSELQADVGAGARDAGAARRRGGRRVLRGAHAAHVRHARVGDRRDAAGRGGDGHRPRAAGDHDVPSAGGDRGRHALRARRRDGLRGARGSRPRAPRGDAVLR